VPNSTEGAAPVREEGKKAGRETEGLAETLDAMVQQESYYLFGVAAFSYLDENGQEYERVLKEIIRCGTSKPEELLDSPATLVAYYGNVRIFWCVSLLLHSTIPSYRQPEFMNSQLYKDLTAILLSYRDFVEHFAYPGVSEKKQRELNRRMKRTFDALLSDMGVHELRQNHNVIRYLHSMLLEYKQDHNPVLQDLHATEHKMSTYLNTLQDSRGSTLPMTKTEPMKDDLKRSVDRAIVAVALLEGIADATTRLFHFYPLERDRAEPYLASEDRPGFRREIAELREMLHGLRPQGVVAFENLSKLTTLLEKIQERLTKPTSPIHEAMAFYLVELFGALRDGLDAANQYLMPNYGAVWALELYKLGVGRDQHLVLMDRVAIKEIIRNICMNVRHGVDRSITGTRGDASVAVSLSFRVEAGPAREPETGQITYAIVEFRSPFHGESLSIKPGSTLWSQKVEVEKFGGVLDLTEAGGEALTTLKLISRDNEKMRAFWLAHNKDESQKDK
jgi:hypothetical protein